jgi:hypothetical protein
MSNDFDEAVEAAWVRFEGVLGEALETLGDGSEVISAGADTEEGAAPYLQFAGSGEWIRAEVSSNEFLDTIHEMDDAQHAALEALGWRAPHAEHGPNWWFEIRRDEVAVAVSMAVGALRLVFGVVDPQFLAHDLVPRVRKQLPPKPRRSQAEPPSQELVAGWPESPEELRELVDRALEARLVDQGRDVELDHDDDGDVLVVEDGVDLWVSVSDASAIVRIWGHVVVGVERREQAMIEVNILNRRLSWAKFYVIDDRILVETEVSGAPLVGSQLADRLDFMLHTVSQVRPDLAERTGGIWVNNPFDQGVA